MFKEAYVRGVQNALIQGGHVAFPDASEVSTSPAVAPVVIFRAGFPLKTCSAVHVFTDENADAAGGWETGASDERSTVEPSVCGSWM